MSHQLTQPIVHYSQGDEDEIIWQLLTARGMPVDTGTFVEIGVGDGTQNNTRSLAERGWTGRWIGNELIVVQPPLVTFHQLQVELDNLHLLDLPYTRGCDLFSIDIDGNDYWILEALLEQFIVLPKILIVEYAAGTPDDWIMPYAKGYQWTQGMPFGASLPAWKALLEPMGYTYECHSRKQVNAFFSR